MPKTNLRFSATQRRLIVESITQKWLPILAGHGQDQGTQDCKLCARYYATGCRNCPIRQWTGRHSCRGTPYDTWHSLFVKAYFTRKIDKQPQVALQQKSLGVLEALPEPPRALIEALRHAAIAEIEFLLKLLTMTWSTKDEKAH
jgi:hypothetical protein